MKRLTLVPVLLLALLPARSTHACGPFLERSLLDSDDAQLCEAPSLRFDSRISSLPLPDAATERADGLGRASSLDTRTAGEQDLREALALRGSDADTNESTIAAWVHYREHIRDELEPAFPSELPREFELYLRGARAWHRDELASARDSWLELLELPAEQRKYRSVWAAYMLGRSARGGCDEQTRWFERARQLAADGFVDTLGLAAASWGEQARCRFEPAKITEAIELYRIQLETGDPRAIDSLRMAAEATLQWSDDDPTLLERVARHPQAREVVTAYLIARLGPAMERGWEARWLTTLERSDLDLGQDPGTGELAWLAYQTGDLDRAERWAKLGASADAGTLLGRWVLAKLALRRAPRDQLDDALAQLAALELELRSSDTTLELHEGRMGFGEALPLRESAAAELALLALQQERFADALAALLRAGSWIDAAYVAEQVLTLDELQAFIDSQPVDASEPATEFEHDRRLRWLLARRLARADRWSDALPYYPAELRGHVDQQIRDLARADDPSLDDVARARALWRAATRLRERGMELTGTEVEPDWAFYDGQFAPEWISHRRDRGGPTLTSPSRAERERVWAHREAGMQRFHYRWRAAELGFRVAELLPDNHEATARVLCQSGRWIEHYDPVGAERYYHAMVRRNPRVGIATTADHLRWFPDECSLEGIDFAAQPIPAALAPARDARMRALMRRGWPIAAFMSLVVFGGVLMLGGRRQ